MAQWTTSYINDLPDANFLYIAPGGEKDDEGKTVPRDLRYFPYRDTNGAVDLPHLRNALARIPQSDLSSDIKDRLTAKAQRILEEATSTKSAETLARAVKFVAPDTIEGPIFLFGSRDTDGEIFTAETDYCLDWFGKSGRPVLYEHGLDDKLKTSVMGRQTDFETRDEGIWAQAELNRHARYRKTVDQMIERGMIGYSAGAMPHLARKSATGHITRFPWVEASLTPTPAEPGNLGVHYVKSADALAHLAEVDIDVPAPLKAALIALDEWAESRDDDSLPDGLKVADLIDRLSVDGPAWVKARLDWYAKSGRVLSASTRERLMRHPASLRELADDLDDLLTAADAEKAAKSADPSDPSIETLRLDSRLAALGLLTTGVDQ